MSLLLRWEHIASYIETVPLKLKQGLYSSLMGIQVLSIVLLMRYPQEALLGGSHFHCRDHYSDLANNDEVFLSLHP